MAGTNRPKTGGRAPGTPNRATKEFRETVTKLLSDNAENVALWLQDVATGGNDPTKADPGKALDLLAKLAEFAAPKLSRAEVDANVKASVSIAGTIREFHERRSIDPHVQG